jgi:hypothetical protein
MKQVYDAKSLAPNDFEKFKAAYEASRQQYEQARVAEVRKEETFSTSRPGLVFINVRLEDNVRDAPAFWDKLRHEMNATSAMELPKGVIGPLVNSDFGDTVAMLVAIHGKRWRGFPTSWPWRRLPGSPSGPEQAPRRIDNVQREQIALAMADFARGLRARSGAPSHERILRIGSCRALD